MIPRSSAWSSGRFSRCGEAAKAASAAKRRVSSMTPTSLVSWRGAHHRRQRGAQAAAVGRAGVGERLGPQQRQAVLLVQVHQSPAHPGLGDVVALLRLPPGADALHLLQRPEVVLLRLLGQRRPRPAHVAQVVSVPQLHARARPAWWRSPFRSRRRPGDRPPGASARRSRSGGGRPPAGRPRAAAGCPPACAPRPRSPRCCCPGSATRPRPGRRRGWPAAGGSWAIGRRRHRQHGQRRRHATSAMQRAAASWRPPDVVQVHHGGAVVVGRAQGEHERPDDPAVSVVTRRRGTAPRTSFHSRVRATVVSSSLKASRWALGLSRWPAPAFSTSVPWLPRAWKVMRVAPGATSSPGQKPQLLWGNCQKIPAKRFTPGR